MSAGGIGARRNSIRSTTGIEDLQVLLAGVDVAQTVGTTREEAGLGLGQRSGPLLDRLGVPRDPRGIVLACGVAGAAVLGVAALLSSGDLIGWAYLAVAVVGYIYVQTRFLPTLVWLLIAAYGAWGATSGAAADWIESGLGVVLAGVALLPTAANGEGDRTIQSIFVTEPTVPLVPENGTGTEAAAEPVAHSDAATGTCRLRCLGGLRFEFADRDLTSQIEDKPVLSFLFQFLLARHVLGESRVGRSAAGDEVRPGVSPSSQLDRLRKQLHDLKRDAGPELGSLVRSNRTHVWLDLSKVESDLGHLRDLAERIRKSTTLIGSQLAAEVGQFLSQTEGKEFLAGFEELEVRVNEGRGTAGQTVSAARLVVEEQRADVVRALAEYDDALGRPEAAIPYLKSALDAQPDRQDLARLLVTAYLKSGQTARASEVRHQFALGKE